jgi:uncharacterized membrane protein YphA (DoxX/SURF4 family)
MAIDRRAMGLVITRVCLGVFFLFQGLAKYQWFTDSSMLAEQLNGWVGAVAPGSVSRWYLDQVALPGLSMFARLVPLGEIVLGLALIVGFWTPVFALIALFMVVNFGVASGNIFTYSYLTNGYGLPLVGPTLGLVVGGVRLPWSVR